MPPKTVELLIFGAVCLALAIIGFFIGSAYRRRSAEKTIGSAEEEAKRILNDAMKTAETRKKETLLEAKEEIHQLRQDTERDLRERRAEVQRQEHRIQQKEESLDRKTDNIEAKEEKLAQRAKEIEAKIDDDFGFARCNRSYLVNLQYVERVDRDTVYVRGELLQISRPSHKAFMLSLARYLGGQRE